MGSRKQCAELLKVLNTMGPEVTADQAYRWFDNRRNKKPTKVSSAMNDSGATTSHIMKTSRISKDEGDAGDSVPQDCAPDMHKRAFLAAAIGISTRQVTNWFARRQASQRPAMPRSCWPTLTTEEGMTSAC